MTSKIPGFEYLERVSEAWGTAMGAQTRVVNDAWADMQSGNYGFANAMKAWSNYVQAQFGVLVEVSRGPGYVCQPTWLYFDFKKNPPMTPTALDSGVVTIGKTEARTTQLDKTDFACFEAQPAIPSAVYTCCDWATSVTRSQIRVTLDVAVVAAAKPGQYISFILAKGRTSEPPIAIVMLRIQP